jgi:uncharacterized protein YjbI with pentapeptide repeats
VYQSINGYKVVDDENSSVKCYPLNLLDQFLCPITHEVAQNPVYICSQTGQGNVYDKDAIISWFKNSNIEPLSGVELKGGQIKYIHVLNFFLACLCLEKSSNYLVYHPPHGDILTLLMFARYLSTGHQIKSKVFENNASVDTINYVRHSIESEKSSTDQSIDSIIDLDFENYCCKSLTPFIAKESQQLKYITLEEILCICPITRIQMIKNTLLSNQGILVHKNVSSINPHSIQIKESRLSDFINLFESHGSKNVIRCNDIFNILCPNDVPFDKFNILCDNDSIKSNGNLTNYNLIDQKINIDEQNIDIQNLRYEPYFNHSALIRIFYKKQYDEFYNTAHDSYLECTSTHSRIYQEFKKFDPMVHAKTIIDLNHYIDSNKKYLFNQTSLNSHCSGRLLELRHLNKLPTFVQRGAVQNSDFSYLTLSDCSISKHFKTHYFVGTHFKNVTFNDCIFEWCVFIGVDMTNGSSLHFNNCRFYDSSFYKSFNKNCMTECTFCERCNIQGSDAENETTGYTSNDKCVTILPPSQISEHYTSITSLK